MGVTLGLHLCIEMKMLQTMTVLVMAFVLETTLAGPQYGGGQQAQVSVPAPAPVASPSCWTEQETVWDTQYVDQVTMQCNEVVKQVPQRVSKSVPKQVCDDGGSYGAQPQQVQSSQGGYSGGSFSQSQVGGGGYSGGSGSGGFSSPRDQGNGRAKLRTGSSPDAVNFGK